MCVEPAQSAAIVQGAVEAAFTVISEEDFDDDLGHLVRLLELLLTHESGREVTTVQNLETIISLLSTDDPNEHGFDNTLNLLAILSSLLSREPLQEALITKNLLPRVLEVFKNTYDLAVDEDSERKDKSLVAYARQQLTEALTSAVTTFTDLFLKNYPLSSSFFATLTQNLTIIPGREDLASLACVIIGNLARNDETCTALVDREIHIPLLGVITTTTQNYSNTITELRSGMAKPNPETSGAMAVGVLHSAVGVLKNLSIPAANKPRIAAAGAFSAIREMLAIDGIGAGQVYYSAVSLGRLLVVNNPDNAKLLLSPPSSDEESVLSLFFKVYKKAEELPTKTEISRTVSALLRVIYASPPHPELLTPLLELEDTAQVVWDMLLQDKWPVVRAEGLFTLAMLSRSKEGAEAVGRVFDTEVVGKILDTPVKVERERADKENVKVLLVQLKQHGVKGAEELLAKAVNVEEEKVVEGEQVTDAEKAVEKSVEVRGD
jgi:hypothetical protein